ncbi:MAG: DMT family transporter [Flavobacterium lindanitolerans]|jgi:drug/metabolite transporter (DMT)-like permease|uniref:DMT family transporter n=1 Tax=Flavobacterium TaxID=237 RepID=UPI0006FA12EC|nr:MULTISPECIES: DMT family transporter [Flavobacterium]KQS50122.1 permease [Flavobacterium sp. Leaf359]MBL7866882.1 DMT family transporter [Flavobacterium lindanitolerans]PZQ92199.1 MAG: EamA/RhaT family transporter [Flavobacterium johnsoniae]
MKAVPSKWIFLFFLSLIWGSSFILIKKGLVGLTPFQLGSLRMIFAAVFLLAIGFKSLKNIKQHQWKYIALTAMMGTFFPAFLFSIAQTQIDSSISAVLNSLTPLAALVLGALVFGLNFQRRQIFGVTIGLFGSVLLILSGAVNHPGQNYWFATLAVCGAICYAVNVNLIKKYLSDVNPLSITVGNFAVLLVPALIILFTTNFHEVAHLPNVKTSMLFISVLAVFGTCVANVLYFKLIQISSPIFASSVTYMLPIVACFWGILDGESLTLVQALGAFIVLIGIYLSAKK